MVNLVSTGNCRFVRNSDTSITYYSYDTPVGYTDRFGNNYITSTKYSVTTSKHCTLIKRRMYGNIMSVPEEQLRSIINQYRPKESVGV